MKTFMAVTGGLFASLFLIVGTACAGYAASRVMEFDEKLDLANDRLKVVLENEGVNEATFK